MYRENREIKLSMNDTERFWKKVAKAGPEDCWLWMTGKGKTGYGAFKIAGKMFQAHRVAFALTNQFDSGKDVLHKCDVRSCVNPDHLYAGTDSDNQRDAYARRRRLPVSMRGEEHPMAKLNHAKVEEIRRLYAETGLPQWKIARMFGVGQMNISRIVNRKLWVRD